jgi:hypothetical protein
LFSFNQNIETLCFGKEAKHPKLFQNKPKQTEETLSFLKIPKYALYQTVLLALLFVSVQSKHQNSLCWYRTETIEKNILFWIVLKLVSVPVSVVWNQN